MLASSKIRAHVNKDSSKIPAFAQVVPNVNIMQRKRRMKAFFNSQFGYCSLIWVFHGSMANKYYSSHINSVQYVEYLLTFLDPEIW